MPGSVLTIAASAAMTPTVALDPAGDRVYVAWVGGEAGNYNVFLASSTLGSGEFGAATRVNQIDGDAAPHEQAPAQVEVGPRGEVYVLWQNNTPRPGNEYPASDLRFAVSTDGGRSFGPTTTVNDDAGEIPSSHTFHDVIVADDGTIVVSWLDGRAKDRMLVNVAASGEGTPAAEVPSDIRIARSADAGRTFTRSVIVDRNPCPCCRTSLAVGRDGEVFVGWRKVFAGDVRDIVVARAAPGADDFAEPVRVRADDWVFPGCPHAGPSLTVDGEGSLHVAWYTGQEGQQGLWYASSSDGGLTFSDAVALQTAEFVPPSLVSLARLEDQILVTWDDRTRDAPTIEAAVLNRGRLVPLGGEIVQGRTPVLAAAGDYAFQAWNDGGAVRGRWITTTR